MLHLRGDEEESPRPRTRSGMRRRDESWRDGGDEAAVREDRRVAWEVERWRCGEQLHDAIAAPRAAIVRRIGEKTISEEDDGVIQRVDEISGWSPCHALNAASSFPRGCKYLNELPSAHFSYPLKILMMETVTFLKTPTELPSNARSHLWRIYVYIKGKKK